MPSSSDPSFTDCLKSDRRREFYERHKRLAIMMILIVFLLPFAGLLIKGLFGAVLGALISFAAYYLAPYVVLKLGA